MKRLSVRHWTIRVRLTVLYGALFLIAGTALLAMTYLLVQHSLDARQRPGFDPFRFRNDRPGAVQPGPTARPSVQTSDGRNIPLDEVADEIARQQQEQYHTAALNSLLTQGGLALGGFGIIAVGFAWLISDRALRPVHQITETARRVAEGSLHERIGLAGPKDEVKELADTFDSMLARLDRAFDGQRRFVANAAHELRTPLAINRTLIEVAMGRPDTPEELRHLGGTLLAVNARHEKLIDELLLMARSDEAIISPVPVDLAEIALHVLEQAHTAGGEDSPAPEIRTELTGASTLGDPILLERVVQNLVDNALAYNVPNGWISVTTRTMDRLVELTVTNTGPVIAAYEAARLFEPFRRLHDRTGSAHGTGLGLSIVHSVAQAHRGDVTATPHEGGGLVVRVTLPRR